jgi:hypothetical protein
MLYEQCRDHIQEDGAQLPNTHQYGHGDTIPDLIQFALQFFDLFLRPYAFKRDDDSVPSRLSLDLCQRPL